MKKQLATEGRNFSVGGKGDRAFAVREQALSTVQRWIRLESYSLDEDLPGVAIRDPWVAAVLSRVRGQVLVDGLNCL